MNKLIHQLFKAAYRPLLKLFQGKEAFLASFPPLKFVHYLLVSDLIKACPSVEIEGYRMYLSSKDKDVSFSLLVNGVYGKFATEVFKREIKRGMCIVDIGAHIGYYTLLFAKLTGENGKVFAFEPDPENFSLLTKNVEINGYKNVVLIPKAVSNFTGKTKLFLDKDSSTGHRTYLFDQKKEKNWLLVETVSLDDFFKDRDWNIDLLKIDIEGAEYAAFQGMSGLLKKNNRLKIVTEFYPKLIKEFGLCPEDYLKALTYWGFKFYCINEQKEKIESIDIPEIMRICAGNTVINLLCSK